MIGIYGNLIYDTIAMVGPIQPGESHHCIIHNRIGGLANSCRAAARFLPITAVTAVGDDHIGKLAVADLEQYCTVQAAVDPRRPTSQAVVLADVATNIRTGLVQWGACRYFGGWTPLPAVDWHHVMYLDRLTINNLDCFDGIVSVDFCDSEAILAHRHLLSSIDYLIVAELENGCLADYSLPVRRAVIVHSPHGSYVLEGGTKTQQTTIVTETGLNVVGAGDYFAAHCIANLIIDGRIDLDQVHRNTLALLRAQS